MSFKAFCFDDDFESGRLDEEYMEYIMENGSNHGMVICNGDMLLDAFERGVLFEEFREYYMSTH